MPFENKGTAEQREKMRHDAPASIKYDLPRPVKTYTSPPYDGMGNLARYIKETLEEYSEYPGLKKQDRQKLKRIVANEKALRHILKVVNKYYDRVGTCPNEQEIAFFAPFIAFRVGVR